jgi:UDP-N-acetylglucosamine acyltransferase
MSRAHSGRIHPTAIVSPEAELAPDVEIGPYAVIEGAVRLGAGCVIRPHAHLIGPLTMGEGNQVFTGAVLGERPQHTKYNNEPTSVEIGDHNIFRENVTVHRGTIYSWKTRIGSNNFFMAGSHVAHDCVVGNHCILANGALLGGHCLLQDQVYVSGNAAVHQFVHLGRLALLSGSSATTKDIPPFVIQQDINRVVGVNLVGMRRSGMNNAQIEGVRRAYQIIFHEGHILATALVRVEAEVGCVDAVQEMVTFIRHSRRGINNTTHIRHQEAA